MSRISVYLCILWHRGSHHRGIDTAIRRCFRHGLASATSLTFLTSTPSSTGSVCTRSCKTCSGIYSSASAASAHSSPWFRTGFVLPERGRTPRVSTRSSGKPSRPTAGCYSQSQISCARKSPASCKHWRSARELQNHIQGRYTIGRPRHQLSLQMPCCKVISRVEHQVGSGRNV